MMRPPSRIWLLLLFELLSTASSLGDAVQERRHLRRLQVDQVNRTEAIETNNEFLGIPGTTQTINGYDTALGNEAICWKGAAADLADSNSTTSTSSNAVDALVKTVFPNPLVEDFTLLGKTVILDRCPQGNFVAIQKPPESLAGERLRTLRYYDYSLHVEIDLDTLDGDYIVTDNGTATIALQVVVCSLGKSGFCSPFVHEQANSREAIDNFNSGQEIVTKKKKVKGDLHGGTHIHSPWVFLNLGANRTLTENVTVPMIVNHPGDYFVIGTVQLYTGINGSNAYRWDIANALESGEGRYLLYQDPPDIKEVSNGVLYFSYVAIAISGAIIVFLIVQTIMHRDHQVLQLSQGDFLLVFLFSALVATVCTFLLVPKNDIYCRISYPLILIPIQLMYAITVGRMWRIHAVISPLLLEHLNKGRPGLTQRFYQAITYISFKLHNLFVCKKENMRQSQKGAKQQISKFQLALVVSIFTLPQVIMQVVALIVQPQELVIDFNEDESAGRQTCGSDVPNSQNLMMYSFLMLVLLVIILLIMAHSSRKLPSLFNETRVIYDSTFLSMVLLLLGGAVIALTNGPGTSPDVEYLVSLVLIQSITLNSSLRIMMPKLKMVWKNETVIVSKLVTDHHRKEREKQSTRRGDRNQIRVSGLDMPNAINHGSFSGRADYDPTQTNRLVTLHSCSNDTGFNKRSSVSSSEGPQSALISEPPSESNGDGTESFFIEKAGNGVSKNDENLAVIKESPFKEAPPMPSKVRRNGVHAGVSSADMTETTDAESGESGSSPGLISPNKKVGGSDDNQDGAGAEDEELNLEEAEGDCADKDKKPSFFDKRANGFLKNAMAKGLSWRITDKSDRSDRSVNAPRPDNDCDKIDRSEKSGGERINHKEENDKKISPKRNKKRLSKTIVVTEDETPARRLVLKMLDLQDQLEAVNNKIMSGLAVSQEDWGVITKLTSKLDHTFQDEVEFEWDIAARYEETLKEVMPLDMSGRSWGTPGDTSDATTSKKRSSKVLQPAKKVEKSQGDMTRAQSMQGLTSFSSARLKGNLRKPSKEKPPSNDLSKHNDLLGGAITLSTNNNSAPLSLGDSSHEKKPEAAESAPTQVPADEPPASKSPSDDPTSFQKPATEPPVSQILPTATVISLKSPPEAPPSIEAPTVSAPPAQQSPAAELPPPLSQLSPVDEAHPLKDATAAHSPRHGLTNQNSSNVSGDVSTVSQFSDEQQQDPTMFFV